MTTPTDERADERPEALVLELFGNEDDVRTRERDCDVLFFDLCVEIHFFSFLQAKWIHTH